MKRRLLATAVAAAAAMGVVLAPEADVPPPSAAVAVFLASAGMPVCGFTWPASPSDRCHHIPLPGFDPSETPFWRGASNSMSVL